MFAYNLADIISERVSRVRVIHSIGNVARVFSKPSAICARNQIDARQNAITVTRKYVRYRETRETRALPIPHIVKDDVIGSVAKYELVQQSG